MYNIDFVKRRPWVVQVLSVDIWVADNQISQNQNHFWNQFFWFENITMCPVLQSVNYLLTNQILLFILPMMPPMHSKPKSSNIFHSKVKIHFKPRNMNSRHKIQNPSASFADKNFRRHQIDFFMNFFSRPLWCFGWPWHKCRSLAFTRFGHYKTNRWIGTVKIAPSGVYSSIYQLFIPISTACYLFSSCSNRVHPYPNITWEFNFRTRTQCRLGPVVVFSFSRSD